MLENVSNGVIDYEAARQRVMKSEKTIGGRHGVPILGAVASSCPQYSKVIYLQDVKFARGENLSVESGFFDEILYMDKEHADEIGVALRESLRNYQNPYGFITAAFHFLERGRT